MTVTRRPDPSCAPLSPEQEGLWFVEQLDHGAGTYNTGKSVRLVGHLDVDRLREALADVVDRHEALRTRIVVRDGEPVQIVVPPGDPSLRPELEVLDLRDADEDELDDVTRERSARPFDLGVAPLLRLSVLRVGDGETLVVVGAHHLVCDGQALTVVIEEIGACYAARQRGERAQLPELDVHYPDYAHWQRERLAGEVGDRQRDYWARRLTGAPQLLELPTDRPRPAEPTFRGARRSFRGDPKIGTKLQWFAATHRCTVPMVLLTALNVVLTRYTGQTDIVVGMPIRRAGPQLQGVVGMFANTVALRTDTSGNPTLRELLERVRATCIGAFEHADLPLESVAALVPREHSLSHNPLFQVMLVPGEAAYDGISQPSMSGLAGREAGMACTASAMDLTWVVNMDTMSSYVDYSTDLFDGPTIRRFGEHMLKVIAAMRVDPDQRLMDVPLLTDGDLAQLARFATGPAVDAPPSCVVTDFVARAAADPDATAVLTLGPDPEQLSYRDLELRSRAVARQLRDFGFGPGDVVGVLLPTGVAAVAALLGVLRAGAAYLPLDPANPHLRNLDVLADAGAVAAIAGGVLPGFDGLVLRPSSLHDAPGPAEPVTIDGDQVAYVVSTSGSTGRPKGVMVEHASLRNTCAALRSQSRLGPGQRFLMIPPLSFDASAGCMFPVLTAGATLVIHSEPGTITGADLLRLSREHGITVVSSPSPLWRRWAADLDGVAQPPTPLRQVILGGDRIPVDAVASWHAATNATTELVNHYGPTEATVCATMLTLPAGGAVPSGDYLPIGRPIAGVTAHVLDSFLRPTPPGVPGELYLGGAAPARGYHGRPGETAQRFVPDPFSPRPGARLYRTGDLARFRRDGLLEFVGRSDTQAKIHGYRIEPAEIEAVLGKHPAVRAVAAVVRTDRVAGARLVAYYQPVDGIEAPEGALLRQYLVERLPSYLVPAAFVRIDAVPVNSHGKVDVAALPEPDQVARPYVTPRTPTERRIAAIWAAVLGLRRAGASDNFFELGGHSLLAAKVMLRISDELGVRLPMRTLFEAADLTALASLVDGRAHASPDLRGRAVLPADLVLGAAGPPTGRVLLTGATGFLGAYLLADLLTHSSAMVTCLVRASDAGQASGRVRANLVRYGLWRPGYACRIDAQPGDLSLPLLGLSPGAFDELAATLDVIYHSGGTVDFVRPYEQLAPVNVGGTTEVLRLAMRGATPVHLVSTLGVYLGGAHAGALVTEADEPADPSGLTSGYDQSKWVADALARQARTRGLAVSVYRPARIAGASATGAANVDDYFSRLIKTIVELGAAPALDTVPGAERHADLSPVDFVAAAIGALSRTPSALGHDFHFFNHRTLGLDQLVRTLSRYGYDLRELPAAQWQDTVAGSDLPLGPLLGPSGSSSRRAAPKFDCSTTDRLLAEAGIECPPADEQLLQRYLDAFVATGYLPTPLRRSS